MSETTKTKRDFNTMFGDGTSLSDFGYAVSKDTCPTEEAARSLFINGWVGDEIDHYDLYDGFVRFGMAPSEIREAVGDDTCWHGPVAESRGAKAVWFLERKVR